MMPSGQNYMRTIGKQTVEASTEDKKDNDSYENEETNLEYVHNFGARIPIKHGANIDSGCSTPLGEMLNCKNRCWFIFLLHNQCYKYHNPKQKLYMLFHLPHNKHMIFLPFSFIFISIYFNLICVMCTNLIRYISSYEAIRLIEFLYFLKLNVLHTNFLFLLTNFNTDLSF